MIIVDSFQLLPATFLVVFVFLIFLGEQFLYLVASIPEGKIRILALKIFI